MSVEGHQTEATPAEASSQPPELELKSKKAPTGARARSIKTPLQREALEAAYLSESAMASSTSVAVVRSCHSDCTSASETPSAKAVSLVQQ